MTAPEQQNFPELELSGIIGYDGNSPKSLRAHPDGVHIVYPLGKKLAVHNLTTRKQFFLEGHTNLITAVAISKSGEYIASGQVNYMGFRAPIIVWSFSNRVAVLQHEAHKVRVESVTFSSCEKFVMSLGGKDDCNLIVFRIDTKSSVCGTFSSNKTSGDALTMCPLNLRGECVMTGGVGNLKVWSIDQKNKQARSVDVSLGKIRRKVICIEITKDDRFAYCGTSTGDVIKILLNYSDDLSNITPVKVPCIIGCFAKIPRKAKTQTKTTKPVQPILYSLGVRQMILMDDGHIIIAAGDGTLELVREENTLIPSEVPSRLLMPTLPMFTCLRNTTVRSLITSIQMVKNQILVGTIQCEMYLVDYATFDVHLVMTCHTSPIFDLCFPSDYSSVFATAGKNDVRVWSVESAKELLRITVPNFTCSGVVFSHDGTSIITSWNDGHIRAFTPQTGKPLYTIYNAHNKGVSAIAVTSDGKRLLSGGGEGQIRVWELRKTTQVLLAVLKEHKGPVSAIDISSTNKEAASASTDGTCIIWDLEKFIRLAIMFSTTLFMCVRYHPSNCQLVTCGTNRQIGYWEVFDGQLIREVEGSRFSALNSLAMSNTGEYFVTGGNDQKVKVWLYQEGITTHVGLAHASVVTNVKISPNNKFIVTSSADGSIFIWKSPFPDGAYKDKDKGKVTEGTTGDTGGSGDAQVKPPSSAKSKASSRGGERRPSRVQSKEEIIKKISPSQSVHSVNNATPPKSGEHKSEVAEGGSIKCYCVTTCNCTPSLPKSPQSQNNV